MALTVVYKRDTKSARVNGSLGLSSVESVAVESDAGESLASGSLCLHHPSSDAALAEWAITDGACETDTRTAALAAVFAALEPWARPVFLMRVKDADGNLLGCGECPVVNSCGESEGGDGFPASGGPLTLEAASEIDAGCPCRIAGGLAAPCAAANAEDFAGIALAHADAGETVQICRWGAAHVAGWGLTPGERYYLPQAGQALTTDPGAIVLCAGFAQDADTLVLTGGRLAVQPRAAGSPGQWFLTWNAATGRLEEQSAGTILQAALGDLLAELEPLVDPTDSETLARVNALLALLKGE